MSTVDLILHCGDLETLGILDHLETIAPVKAVRGYGDPHELGDRLAEQTRVIKIDDIRIGMIHDINWPGPSVVFSDTLEFNKVSSIDSLLEQKFGETVDIGSDFCRQFTCPLSFYTDDDTLRVNIVHDSVPAGHHNRA